MSDKVVGYACVGTMIAVVVANLVMVNKVTELKDEVLQLRTDVGELRTSVGEIKKDVVEVQKQVVLYRSKDRLTVSAKDMHCLAMNIFNEAGVEDRAGKIAVAQVTLNRLNTGKWGNTICDVVYAKAQFSWTRDRKKRWKQPKGDLWNASVAIAADFVHKGRRVKGLEGSGFYHTDYIKQPTWAIDMKVVHRVGSHIFYGV